MPSKHYQLCFDAILDRKQLVFIYRDRQREICPHVLGLSKDNEMLLGYQFGGEASTALPPDGEWRCFRVAEMHSIEQRDGVWHTGRGHSQTHSCVADVDLDVNPHAPQRSWAMHNRKV